MFNGVIFKTGKIKIIERKKQSFLIGIKSQLRFKNSDLGSSISCNGVCLTLTKISGKIIFFYLSNETLKKSNFKNLKINQVINLEKSLTYGKKISGHFIQGHVDTTAKIKTIYLQLQSFTAPTFSQFDCRIVHILQQSRGRSFNNPPTPLRLVE